MIPISSVGYFTYTQKGIFKNENGVATTQTLDRLTKQEVTTSLLYPCDEG